MWTRAHSQCAKCNCRSKAKPIRIQFIVYFFINIIQYSNAFVYPLGYHALNRRYQLVHCAIAVLGHVLVLSKVFTFCGRGFVCKTRRFHYSSVICLHILFFIERIILFMHVVDFSTICSSYLIKIEASLSPIRLIFDIRYNDILSQCIAHATCLE